MLVFLTICNFCQQSVIEMHCKYERLTFKLIYRKTPNKRPWAFAGSVGLKRTVSPFKGFLRNENWTILS